MEIERASGDEHMLSTRVVVVSVFLVLVFAGAYALPKIFVLLKDRTQRVSVPADQNTVQEEAVSKVPPSFVTDKTQIKVEKGVFYPATVTVKVGQKIILFTQDDDVVYELFAHMAGHTTSFGNFRGSASGSPSVGTLMELSFPTPRVMNFSLSPDEPDTKSSQLQIVVVQ